MYWTEYPYKDVLEIVYGITFTEDIRKVTVTAANMDNSDEGKRIQEEIVQYEITNSSELYQLYDILSDLNCYRSNHWDMIDYGTDDADVIKRLERIVEQARCRKSQFIDYGRTA